MKWYSALTQAMSRLFNRVKLNHIAKTSLIIALLLFFRKIFKNSKQVTPKILLQNISNFYQKLTNNQIKNVSILTSSIQYQDQSKNIFRAILPRQAQSYLQDQLRKKKISFQYARQFSTTNYMIIVALWTLVGYFCYKVFVSDDHGNMQTNSRPQKSISFDDVIGLGQCKQSLRQIIRYMKQPQRHRQIGARMRKGIVFYGPSGTGKTTLAKATAGQAGVPFFSCNASQFCQIYVGMGPKRVKQLFKKAKQSAPSIIYIDQIDAIGNRKNSGMFNDGASSQKNSTINQLLSQMDGFSTHQQVLVIASTNRLQMIDSSLLRAGRFDLKIKIPLPCAQDRYEILRYHLGSKKHVLPEMFMMRVCQDMEGWSGADLETLANQAVYTSLRGKSQYITQEGFMETLNKMRGQMY